MRITGDKIKKVILNPNKSEKSSGIYFGEDCQH